jgi:hypothetical protein
MPRVDRGVSGVNPLNVEKETVEMRIELLRPR